MRQLADWKSEVEEVVFPGKICVPYSWTVGSTLSRWYVQLRDDGEIWANRCPSCGTVYVPPKIKCIKCYKDMNDWVKLPGTGTIETFTVVNKERPGLDPKKPPFVYAVIKMDGADTGMVHLIGGRGRARRPSRCRDRRRRAREGEGRHAGRAGARERARRTYHGHQALQAHSLRQWNQEWW